MGASDALAAEASTYLVEPLCKRIRRRRHHRNSCFNRLLLRSPRRSASEREQALAAHVIVTIYSCVYMYVLQVATRALPVGAIHVQSHRYEPPSHSQPWGAAARPKVPSRPSRFATFHAVWHSLVVASLLTTSDCQRLPCRV